MDNQIHETARGVPMADKRIAVKKHEAILAAREVEHEERVRLLRVEIFGYHDQLLALLGQCESVHCEHRCTSYKGHDTNRHPHQKCVHLGPGLMTVVSWADRGGEGA